jgi:hypothetical protein
VSLQWCHSQLGWLVVFHLFFEVVFHFFLGRLPFFWGRLPISYLDVVFRFLGRHSSLKPKNWGRLPFSFLLKLSSIFIFCRSSSIFSGCLSSWVKIRLHTENQLHTRLPGSALKFPTHYKVKLQLMLMLSWAVTIFSCFFSHTAQNCIKFCVCLCSIFLYTVSRVDNKVYFLPLRIS